MRLVFISSVTAITPLRTISVTTGSARCFLAPVRFGFFCSSFRCIDSLSVVPAQAWAHTSRPIAPKLSTSNDPGLWVPALAGTTATKTYQKLMPPRRVLVRVEAGEPGRDLGHESLHRAGELLARTPVLADDQEQRAEAADLVVERL